MHFVVDFMANQNVLKFFTSYSKAQFFWRNCGVKVICCVISHGVSVRWTGRPKSKYGFWLVQTK